MSHPILRHGYKPVPATVRETLKSSLNLYAAIKGPELESASFRGHHNLILDQGLTESCVLNAAAGAMRDAWSIQGVAYPPIISRADSYRRARLRGGIAGDDGCYPTDAWQILDEGYCLEDHWPFNIANIDLVPPPDVRRWAFDQVGGVQLFAIPDDPDLRIAQIEQHLTALKPVCIGISVHSGLYTWNPSDGPYSFESGKNVRQGRHYIELVGYDRPSRTFEAANSWSKDWGDRGFFRLTYNTVRDYYSTTDPHALLIAALPSDFDRDDLPADNIQET